MIGKENFCGELNLLRDALDTLTYVSMTNEDDYSSIAILCQEDLAESLIKHICVLTAINEIELDINYISFDKDDYHDEYGLVLTMFEGALSLSLEKVLCTDGDYKYFDMDYLYISEYCDPELVVKHIDEEADVFTICYEC